MARTKTTAAKSSGGVIAGRVGGGGKVQRTGGKQPRTGGKQPRTVPRKQLATKAARKAALAATSTYTDEEIDMYKSRMNSDCMYCGEHLLQREMMCSHILRKCNKMVLPERYQDEIMSLRARGDKAELPVRAGVFKWKACPLESLCDITMAKFPDGTVCAPFNWMYVAMDSSTEKAVGAVRGTQRAFLYKHKKTGEERTRFYADKRVHQLWEEMVNQKIAKGEVTEVLIPVVFWYWNQWGLKSLEEKNHAALLVVNIVDKKWTNVSFYDSQKHERYFQKAKARPVRDFLLRGLLKNIERAPENVGQTWINQEPIYHSLCGNGCQGVVFFWLHLRYMGKPIQDPNCTGTVDFFKGIMFNSTKKENPNPFMRGENFDVLWKRVNFQERRIANLEKEMETHLQDYAAALQKLHIDKD